MTLTATRGEHDMVVELAATVLAVQQCVGKVLAKQRPSIGQIAEQARAAWSTAGWDRLSLPVAEHLTDLCSQLRGGAELAPKYAAELGEKLDSDAAQGLDHAMDIQLSRGQHPDVAWQRAVAGYGLTPAAMRAYVSAVTTVKDGSVPLITAARAMAKTALLRQADRIGTREVTAWSTLPDTGVAKAFDPEQARDESGKWTAGANRRATAVKEKQVAPDAVDELLGQTPVKPDTDADRYRYADSDRYRYADTDRYRYADADRYRYADADKGRYQQEAAPVRRIILFGGKKIGEKTPPKATPTGSGPGMYVPTFDLRSYYHDNSLDTGLVAHHEVDFGVINTYLRDVHLKTNGIEGRAARSGWDVAVGFDVRADDWDDILTHAVPLWHEVQDDPMAPAAELDVEQLSDVAKRAGYEGIVSGDAILEQIAASVEMRDKKVTFMRRENGDEFQYDPVLLDALADYVVWSAPKTMGPKGVVLANSIGTRILRAELNQDVPEVMKFDALAEDENAARLLGTYRVADVDYYSAIGSRGYAAPLGKIALREVHLTPERM